MRSSDSGVVRSYYEVLSSARRAQRESGSSDHLRLLVGGGPPRPRVGLPHVLDELHAIRGDVAAAVSEVRALRSLVNTGRRKYDVEGAAARLGVSDRTLRRKIAQGLIVASREGGRVFVTESAIRDYEDHCRRRAA